jgi:hypothetical protein
MLRFRVVIWFGSKTCGQLGSGAACIEPVNNTAFSIKTTVPTVILDDPFITLTSSYCYNKTPLGYTAYVSALNAPLMVEIERGVKN